MDLDADCNNAWPFDFFKRQNCVVALLEISRHIYGRACFVDFLTFLLRGLAKAQLAGRQKRLTIQVVVALDTLSQKVQLLLTTTSCCA